MMDKRDIFEALGNIDERYVESAALSLDGKKKYAPRSFRLLPIAACLAILALSVRCHRVNLGELDFLAPCDLLPHLCADIKAHDT